MKQEKQQPSFHRSCNASQSHQQHERCSIKFHCATDTRKTKGAHIMYSAHICLISPNVYELKEAIIMSTLQFQVVLFLDTNLKIINISFQNIYVRRKQCRSMLTCSCWNNNTWSEPVSVALGCSQRQKVLNKNKELEGVFRKVSKVWRVHTVMELNRAN
jgi:hypothetical protein